jgi:hypothetical protein
VIIEQFFPEILERVGFDQAVRPAELDVNNVPKTKGVYIWYMNRQSTPAYIGKATSKTGLRGRVLRQHLNPKYLENRAEKMTSKDDRQLAHGTLSNGKVAIEKSVFRKHLARLYDLPPGKCSVDFIHQNFSVLLIPLPGLSSQEIRNLEDSLVKVLNPKLNVVGNRSKHQI